MPTVRYERELSVDDGWEVVVAGGGPAGCAAALAAARLGARVLLVEGQGCLGGMATSGFVTAFDPMADGERGLVGGIMREIVETLYERGGLGPQVKPEFWRKNYHCWTPFRVEALKLLLDELMQQAGVEVRFFTRVIDAEPARDGTLTGLILHDVEGVCCVRGRTFIDATGDAVVAHLAGAEYREAGRDGEPAPMPGTLCSLFAGVDWQTFRTQGKYEQNHYLPRAIAEGQFTQPDRHLPGMSQVGHTIGYLNGGHVFGLNAVNARSLSDGMRHGRRLVAEYAEFYRKYVPGFAAAELVTTAPCMGVRETRRIVGEYQLCYDDYIARRQFPDQIGIFNKFVDIHVRDCGDAEWERFCREKDKTGRLGAGECFGLPYGILVPRGWRNLWVAGRCASSDVRVHGSIRVQPAAAMMGQAAGTAAAQSLRTGQPACELDTAELVQTLREHGAILPQAELSHDMTRDCVEKI